MSTATSKNNYPAGTHIQIHGVKVTIKKDSKLSKFLDVSIDGKEHSTSLTEKDSIGDTHHWTFNSDCTAFPDAKVRIIPLFSRGNHILVIHREKVDVFEISAKDIIAFCVDASDRGQLDSDGYAEYSAKGKNSELFVKVTSRGFIGITQDLTTATNAKQPEDIDVLVGLFKQVSLGEAWFDGITQLRSILEPIADNMDVVQKLEEGLETLASVHPIAKAAIVALMIPFNMMKKEAEFVSGLKGLGNEMKELLTCLSDARYAAKITSAANSVAEIIKTVLEASQYINDFMNKGALERFTAAQFSKSLDGYKNKFVALRESFRDAMIVQIAVNVDELQSNASNAVLRDRLAPAPQEAIDSGCMDGTRVSVLKAVSDWLSNPNASNILWISGAPGAGKTAISATVVRDILKYRCAKFFFKKGVVGLQDPRRVWRTVAIELANMYHGVKTDILELLSTDRRYPQDAEVKDQFRDLVEAPLLKLHGAPHLTPTTPPVLVIDALDECTAEKDADWSDLLETLVEWNTLPPNFKLLVTSRDESDIRERLRKVSVPIAVETGNDVSEESTSDIRHFFQTRFKAMNVSDPSWPGVEVVDQLTKYAAGLFVWANTVVDFVGQRKGDPVRRLKSLLANMGKQSDVVKIDRLYGQVLFQIFSGLTEEEHNDMIMVLGTIVFSKDALRVSEIVELLAARGDRPLDGLRSSVEWAIDNLRPVISVRDPDQLVQVCHKTFADFVGDEARVRSSISTLIHVRESSPSAEMDVDPNTIVLNRSHQNALLLQLCLQLMNGKLAFNICHLPTSHIANEGIKDLDKLVAENIGSVLMYACRHWADHLTDVSEGDPMLLNLLPLLSRVMFEHTLHWLEVLSLAGSLRCAVPILMAAALYTQKLDKDLSDFCRDASRFATTFRNVIKESAPHIYISALPFAPTNSKIAEVFAPKFGNVLSVVSGRKKNWDQMIMKLNEHSDRVTCVAFYAEGKRLVSGSLDKTICIWDAERGDLISDPIVGHTSEVLSLAVTKDGKQLATGCRDGTIRIFAVETGRCAIGPVNAHRFKVASLVFVSQTRLVSASCDGTVNVWDVSQTTMKSCFGPLEKHTAAVYSVASSPDGLRFVSSSLDKTLIIWNAQKGTVIGQPLLGHDEAVSSVAYSPNGKFIASGSDDCTIHLWDSEGKPLLKPMTGHSDAVFAVTFSRDNQFVISGSRDGSVRFWEVKSRDQVQVGESFSGLGPIHAIAFSPLQAILATGHRSSNILIWDVSTTESESTSDEGHDDSVVSIAFDAEGKRLVSSSKDGEIRIWDASSGECLVRYRAKVSGPTFVGFVPEGDRVVVGVSSGEIDLISSTSGQKLQSTSSPQKNIMSIAVNPKGKHFASGSRENIILWDYSSCTRVGQLVGHDGNVLTLAFSPDGSTIASGSDDTTVRLWKTEAAQSDGVAFAVLAAHTATVNVVGFNRDGTQLASGSFDDRMVVWDVSCDPPSIIFSGDAHLKEANQPTIDSLAFYPNGPAFVTGGGDRNLILWDVEKWKSIGLPVKIHDGAVLSIAFSPDGKRVATGSVDTTVKIWDVIEKDGMPVAFREKNTFADLSNIHRVSFSKEDGKRLIDDGVAIPKSATHFAFFDGVGNPCIGDWSTVSWTGWVLGLGDSDDDDKSEALVFWLPPENQTGFWMPRNSAVMSRCTTRIDFSRFMHGENWERCRTESV
ncbi:WD40 repeat-like protein [Schizopora paradoxa]|uniref:WD40 repeat-like protein n=1 Tax=Schizopora paradoxa TaxID=27342 RepID=A0A0H2RSI5_9AGAM|nr:WD40 repeat-like protein [Schizopora paradoxa]